MRYLGLFISLLVFSCTKESIPDPVPDQSPVFHVEGDLQGESFDYRAGDDNMVMETEVSSMNGVATYNGTLTDGTEFIQLIINDGNIDFISTDWAQSLPENLSFFKVYDDPITTLSKDYFSNHELIESVDWFIDGQFVGVNEVPVYKSGKFNVCAKVNFEDGQEATLCNDLIIGYKKNATAHLRHFLAPNGTFKAWIDFASCETAQVKWYIDETYFGSDENLITTLDKGIYQISAEVTYTNGVKRTLKVAVDGSLTGHFIDDLTLFEDVEDESLADFNVTLIVKRNGVTYKSVTAQNEESLFKVNSITPYQTNPDGTAVFKVDVQVNCFLFDELTGQSVPFEMEGVIGIASNP